MLNQMKFGDPVAETIHDEKGLKDVKYYVDLDKSFFLNL